MKKDTERYFLIEYIGNAYRSYKTEEEYSKLLETIKSYNRKTKYDKLFGNVIRIPNDCTSNNDINVQISIFNRLSSRRTLKDIDLEMYYRPGFDAITKVYGDKIKYDNPDIYIAYFETKNTNETTVFDPVIGIKGLPLLFNNEQRYFDNRYIKERMEHYADLKDLVFFSRLCNELCFNKNSLCELERLRESINSVEAFGFNSFILSCDAYTLYRTYAKERDAHGNVLKDEDGDPILSHRRIRDVGTFIMNYDLEKAKMTPRIIDTTQFNVEHGDTKNNYLQLTIE